MGITNSGAAVRRTSHHRRASSWPFMAQPAGTAITEQGVGVPRRQEVEFADGSKIWLLRVELNQGVPELFLRDLHRQHQQDIRVDLRDLVPELANDLPVASTRDVPGLVHFSLRGRFKSLEQLLEVAAAGGRPA